MGQGRETRVYPTGKAGRSDHVYDQLPVGKGLPDDNSFGGAMVVSGDGNVAAHFPLGPTGILLAELQAPFCGAPRIDSGELCAYNHPTQRRGVAQPGSAPALGAGSRWFKSSLPDQER